MKWLKIGATIVVTAATFGWLGYDLGMWWTAQTLRDRGMEALKESRLADAQHYYIALDSLGDREADFWLGQINVEGYGVPINHDRAIYWFARAPE
ncbi:MAG: hypothetical protein M3N13_04710, partial [Candidatus Eremiobacteraeota bacterium]|nr:hypothetical protein [Candidatus Eremiobacteraeota bacterium]